MACSQVASTAYKAVPRALGAGFTAIEMVAALFLAGLLAAMPVIWLGGLRQSVQIGDVADQLAFCDHLARQSAAGRSTRLTLGFFPDGRVISEMPRDDPDDGPPAHLLYRLPEGFNFGRLLAGAGSGSSALSIDISPAGISQSYAVQLVGKDGPRWLLIAGLSGQVIHETDEKQVADLLDGCAAGDDAH